MHLVAQSKLDEQDGRLFRSPVRATLPPLTSVGGGGEGDKATDDDAPYNQPAGLAMLLTEPPPIFKPPGTPPMLASASARPLPHISTPPIPRKGQTGHTVAMGHRQSSMPTAPKAVRSLPPTCRCEGCSLADGWVGCGGG